MPKSKILSDGTIGRCRELAVTLRRASVDIPKYLKSDNVLYLRRLLNLVQVDLEYAILKVKTDQDNFKYRANMQSGLAALENDIANNEKTIAKIETPLLVRSEPKQTRPVVNVENKTATVPQGYGFWDLTHYGWGGSFHRAEGEFQLVNVEVLETYSNGSPKKIKGVTTGGQKTGVEL